MSTEIINEGTINKFFNLLDKAITKLDGFYFIIFLCVLAVVSISIAYIIYKYFSQKNEEKTISTSGNKSPIITGKNNSITYGKRDD